MVLEMMATLGLPPLETMAAVDALARSWTLRRRCGRQDPMSARSSTARCRARPATSRTASTGRRRTARTRSSCTSTAAAGCSAIATSDDPLCRDLCVPLERRDRVRRLPPCAGGTASPRPSTTGSPRLRWVADHAVALGGIPGELAVFGWSAGGNLAAVVCQLARDAGGPAIVGQVLLTPVTDSRCPSGSYAENGEGYILTAALMKWFWDHYADEADRSDHRASPLRADDLSGLPPAIVVTCEFDPLRDEGVAYAEALAAAGVPVQHIAARGHTHTSLTMVDIVLSGAKIRAEIANALSEFFGATVPTR